MLRKKLRGKIIKKQLFLEECINLYKNNSTFESHRFNYVKIVSYRIYHSTWKRCKHSGHFSRFRNIIGNVCIIKQKCLCNYVINISPKMY
jgi:hypothetical protein